MLRSFASISPISGKEITVKLNNIKDFFEAALDKLDEGIEKGWDEKTVPFFLWMSWH